MRLNFSMWRALAGFWFVAVATVPVSAQVWQDLGPGRILGYMLVGGASGRVSAIAGHPTDPMTYYLGGADGGVWKTTNDGLSWTPLTDGMPANSIGSIAIDPSNPNRIYVGTGEANRAFHCRYGLGIYRSDDSGATWVQLPRSGGVHVESTFDGRCIGRICIDPSNTNHLFAAVTRSAGDRNGKRHAFGEIAYGLFVSSDAGESWTHVDLPGTTSTWGCTDVVRVSGSVFLAAVWDDSSSPAKVFRSADAGANWTEVGSSFQHRMALAPAAGGSVAWALDSTGSSHRLWRSSDGGVNWSNTNIAVIVADHVWQALVLTAHPTDVNKVYFGGTYNGGTQGSADLQRYVNGDAHSTPVGGHHEDMRSVGWRADNHLIIGNDGGIEVSETVDSGQTWDPQWVDRNDQSLGITQILPGISAYPTSATYIFAGTQDNGGIRRASVGADARTWHHTVGGGDGGANVVDTHAPGPGGEYRVYSYPHTGAITKPQWSDDIGVTWAGPAFDNPPPSLDGRRYFQMAVDVTDPATNDFKPLFIAHKPLVVGIWDSQAQDFAWQSRSNQLTYSIRGMAVGPHQLGSQRVYATYNDGNELHADVGTSWIASSNDGGASFNAPSTAPANFEDWQPGTRDVALDPSNPSVAYCTSSRWRTSAVPSRVWFTSDGGNTWTGRDGVTGSMVTPAPVNCVAVLRLSTPQRRVVVGTDQGVWITLDDGLHWGKYGTGLPNSSVVDLVYDAPRSRLLAATLGRGIWSISAPTLVADVANAASEAVPDGQIDASDVAAFSEWVADSPPEHPDLRADAGGDGEVGTDDCVLFLEAYDEGW